MIAAHHLVRFSRWLLGDLPTVDRDARPTRLLVLVTAVAVVAFLLDLRHPLRARPLVKDTWTFTCYFAVPMVGLAWWEVRRRGRGALLAALGTVAVATPVGLRLVYSGATRAFKDDPWMVLVPVATGALLLVLAARRAGARLSRDWGLGLGDWRWWVPRAGLMAGIMVPMVLLAALAFPGFLDFYPQYKPARSDVWMLVYYQASLGMYMLAWEFFFRGFLTHGLARRGDVLMALFFQAMPFFLLHRTKPEAEMLASFVGSILIAWFCLRARSFLPAWLLHWGMNLSMEVMGFLARSS